jgi:protein-S-isoprenylcysteine O-methyltransferase Ste14
MTEVGLVSRRLEWGRPLDATTERRLARLADLGERLAFVVLFAGLAVRVGADALHQPANLLILLTEGLVVVFMVFRRRAVAVSTRPMDWLVALLGTAGPMLVAPGGRPVGHLALGVAILMTGLLFAIWGKLSLRRSYGLAAANRGVVQSGPYGFVRHPIYAGYVLTYIGFFMNNPTWRNAATYAVSLALIVIRIHAEEAILRRDPLYAGFMSRVRYRLVPGFF